MERRVEIPSSLAARGVLPRWITAFVAVSIVAILGCATIAATAIDSSVADPAVASPVPAPAPQPAATVQRSGFGATPLGPDERFRVAGAVAERLTAGSYTYLRVHVDGAQPDAWIVLSEDPARVAAMDRVDVLVMARAERFHSRRLDREFPVLLFASTTATNAAPSSAASRRDHL